MTHFYHGRAKIEKYLNEMTDSNHTAQLIGPPAARER